jgi:DNA-directed RNA polymerase specialized sigma24 family protein
MDVELVEEAGRACQLRGCGLWTSTFFVARSPLGLCHASGLADKQDPPRVGREAPWCVTASPATTTLVGDEMKKPVRSPASRPSVGPVDFSAF